MGEDCHTWQGLEAFEAIARKEEKNQMEKAEHSKAPRVLTRDYPGLKKAPRVLTRDYPGLRGHCLRLSLILISR